MGGSYQGTVELLDVESNEGKYVMQMPIQYQSLMPKDMKYRFNWNAPIVYSMHEPNTYYHGANILFKTTDRGRSWTAISGDLTRNDTSRQGMSGTPFTNEGAGGENYGTLSYVIESPHEKGLIYTGSDDGLVHLTRDGGKTWTNITPAGLPECLVNSIEVSPHQPSTVYIATTRYKFNDFAPGIYRSDDYGKSWVKIVNGISPSAYTRVVREDTKRKGLLYAGTETGFYISFNNGQDWKQLQLGLPITPVTDLKVHHDDLLASTMGRAFWILDDIEVLRELDQAQLDKMKLYQPADVVRTSAFSQLNAPADVDEPRSPYPSFVGTNKASGAVIYYQLPEPVKDSAITLEIINSRNEVVRSYSSLDDEDFVGYAGGPDAEPKLTNRKGLNRFVWDLRGEPIKGVPTVFIEGSFDGYRVAPGTYTARLKVKGMEQSASFKVLPHPGLDFPASDYAEQEALMKQICEETSEIHLAVNRNRKTMAQLKETHSLLKDKKGMEGLAKQADSIASALQAWEDDIVQNKAKSNDDIINYVNKLTADYIFVKGEMDANTPYVTKGQRDQFNVLHGKWEALKLRKTGLDKDIEALNREIQKAGVGRIIF